MLAGRIGSKPPRTKDGSLDVLTFIGNATFVDDERLIFDKLEEIFNDDKLLKAQNVLKAQTIKVKLEPVDNSKATARPG